MTRRLLYVAHPVAHTDEEVRGARSYQSGGRVRYLHPHEISPIIVEKNVKSAGRWLQWLRKSFPETTFIAPWIADILTGGDDSDPAQRERGLADCCATVERCDGIVLCGPRISSGMQREMNHGMTSFRMWLSAGARMAYATWGVYDLTSHQIEGDSSADGRTFERWMADYRESCTR